MNSKCHAAQRQVMAKVSVIIPTYNRETFVMKAVGSVLKQTFRDYELIVIDDGSTDATRSTLQPYEHQIKYVYQDNSGVSAARNKGVNLAAGDWVAFLDSDDEWSDEYLAKQMQTASKASGVCMQVADCLFTGLGGKKNSYFEMNGAAAEFKGADYLLPREPFSFVIQHAPWQVGSAVIRREAIRKAGLFDTSLRISEDLDLIARVALQGPFGLLRDQLVTIYRRRESVECLTGQAQADPMWARESNERIYKKLAKIETLKHNERRALSKVMSANRRAMGNLLLKNGRTNEARECYTRAFLIDPSLRSLARYILSLPHLVSSQANTRHGWRSDQCERL